MNALVLGGNGYLGSKVCKALLREGFSLVCTRFKHSDISMFSAEDDILWIPATAEAVEAAFQFRTIDTVINMVCNYGKGGSDAQDVIDANLVFPLSVLNIACAHQVKKFITIGTSLPSSLNMYSLTKEELSRFGKWYAGKQDVCFVNILPEMFYGSDEPKDRFLPSTISKMLKGEEVNTTVGTQRRDIISAHDLVQAIIIIALADLKGHHEISVGTGEAPTVSEVIDYIWEKTGRKSKVNKGAIPARQNEPDCVADPSFLKSLGAWTPVSWKRPHA